MTSSKRRQVLSVSQCVPIEPLEARRILSVTTLHTALPFSADPTTFRDQVYFAARDKTHGAELWRTDGTAAGTKLFKDFNPGPADTTVSSMLVMNDVLYVAVGTQTHQALWRTDGTAAGTRALLETDGDASIRPTDLTVVGGKTLYFVAPTSRGTLWKSDGTGRGTVPLVNDAIRHTDIKTLADLNGVLVFDGLHQHPSPVGVGYSYQVFRSDGTNAGTTVIHSYETSFFSDQAQDWESTDSPTPLTVAGDSVYFLHPKSTSLWTSKGTAGSGSLVSVDGLALSPRSMWSVKGRLVFIYSDAFWDSLASLDGNSQSVHSIARLESRLEYDGLELSMRTRQFVISDDGFLYYSDGNEGTSLWRTDGTTSTQLASMSGAAGLSNLNFATALGGKIYFNALDSYGRGWQPWVSDGTSASMNAIEYGGVYIGDSVTLNGKAIFLSFALSSQTINVFDSLHGDLFGRVYNDVPDAATPEYLSGVKVFLDANNDGVRQASEPNAVTSSTGRYNFFGLQPGTYHIGVEPYAKRWEVSSIRSIVSVRASMRTKADIGIVDTRPTGSVDGTVYRDSNHNGALDEGEGVKGFRVFIDANANGTFDAREPVAWSAANGQYRISDFAGGE